MLAALASIDTWIFDLDNTLYPASCDLFGLIDQRMTDYVARVTGLDHDAAYAQQKRYFHEHGTTLSGMMADHGVDPHDFLADVHAIEMDVLREDRLLIDAIARLPGRKLVFTNGDEPYARRVLARLGLSESFEAIHDIHAMAYQPKPHADAYASMLANLRVTPETALFAEDMARNLRPAKALGLTTLWVDNGSEQVGVHDGEGFIDYRTADLGHWLESILEEK
ncbi:putative hydrolase of the HAD superfamily [Sphingomonas vulcanisoli]|uniref:Hydrolase of the HAD superfamily n=1 Tax=Sphingomonas vulcanisoli TaxID=1658060 RepID=A0ABX0TVW2_9SPHN|nr:pyrimidine 5'-nucleotidase [Sphingomonas vulcanisoli]NIJ09168.1 putative hydrolase of the HAD superfamily [Sphingomonas vulcanisoli]